jgi:hypothetical protein
MAMGWMMLVVMLTTGCPSDRFTPAGDPTADSGLPPGKALVQISVTE